MLKCRRRGLTSNLFSEIVMKKIISIILILTLLASLSVVFTSCNKNEGKNNGGTNHPSGGIETPGENNGGDKAPDSDETPGDDVDPDPTNPPPLASKLIGLVGVLDAYAPDENKTYIRVDVPQFTDTVVYLISYEAIPNLSAKFRNVTNGTETVIVLGEWTYDETRGIYYASFNAPNAAGNAMYQFLTTINDVDSGRIFAVQVVKQMNVDPNGWV